MFNLDPKLRKLKNFTFDFESVHFSNLLFAANTQQIKKFIVIYTQIIITKQFLHE